MKYTNTVDIAMPMEKVIELFDNTENMYKWMDGLVGHEIVSGTQGEPGAQMRLFFKMGKAEFSMLETITEKNLPNKFAGSYKTKFATNHVSNSFKETADGHTHMHSETRVEPHSFMVRLMCWISPGTFKKQSQQYLDNFKKFAESGEF